MGPKITKEYQEELGKLVDEFHDLFTPYPGMTEVIQYQIKLTSEVPVTCKPCRLPYATSTRQDLKKTFKLRTDVSNNGINAVLMQEHDEKPYPLSYGSKKVMAAERNYSTIEKECLAIIRDLRSSSCTCKVLHESSQPQVPSLQTRVPIAEQDPKFFSSVDNDAEHIVRHEKMQEEYRKQFASDNAVVAKLRNDLDQKDQQLAEFKSNMEQMEAELKQVKKRNKQLCVILAQGEMKDKAQVLLQVDELTLVKDELTEQVTQLTAELEKEKSKNHSLKAEIEKMKGLKHGK
ncbi:hypothetical protein RRG08_012485 [Elysia crispata]|uniref:Reverse transcriptase RNase H-like domain-containing protein n=1 Tax=Elysia crispata TaxID=231223 RepID=A0AAE1AP50_9GAST|nr:hypothetical protein RRG08_012485 [Elysia crispata]